MTEQRDNRGACSCGWRGPWRTNDTDAKNDAREHCQAEGHTLLEGVFEDDDLMPHERRKKEKQDG